MKRLLLIFLCSVLIISTGCAQKTMVSIEQRYILLDPGHGGFDGGAVASDGTLEKHINLDISLQLRDMLVVCGLPVEMTRNGDISLADSESDTIRNKKVSDMHNRLQMYNGAEVVISIHQNHFQVPKYHGAQVFYAQNNPDCTILAQSVQKAIVTYLQPRNTRDIKAATDGIYLLHHTTSPAVLVECGFLSNPEELKRLNDPTYRQQMAWSIMLGYWKYRLSEE